MAFRLVGKGEGEADKMKIKEERKLRAEDRRREEAQGESGGARGR